MNELDLDTYLSVILLYTTYAHIELEVYEDRMNNKLGLISVVVATLFYLFALLCWEIAQKGW